MGRNITGSASGGAVDGGNKNLRVNQANGYGGVNGYTNGIWHDYGPWWNGQFGSASLGFTISDATSYIKITTQVHVDHGDTWRSGLNRYSIYNSRNSTSGTPNKLGYCASSNYISGHNGSGQIGFSQWFGRPADWVGGLQDGDIIYFKFEFMRQSGGGWQNINNLQVNFESQSNGFMAKAGLAFNVEEIPAAEAGVDWNG
tara:strand:+ start:1763 stop:2362 length:600 start_codon:yes stop_codon:yes gene_type:complete